MALETSDLNPVQHLWIYWPNHSDPQRLRTQRAYVNDVLLTLGYQIPEHTFTGPEESAPQWANTTLELVCYYVSLLIMLLH